MFINVFALAVSIMIFLFVQHEFSYDTYHANADRIVRVSRAWFNPDGETSLHLGHTAPPFGPLIKSDYPDEVAFSARMLESNPLVVKGDTKFIEDNFTFADPEIFDIFSINILEGDSQKALDQNDGLMISESSALKYFGDNSPLGQELLIDLGGQQFTFQVRGVFEDFPDNSHFHPTFFASMMPVVMFYGGEQAFMSNYGSNSISTYLLGSAMVERVIYETRIMVFEFIFPEG